MLWGKVSLVFGQFVGANVSIVNKKLLVKAVFAAEHSGDEM